MTDTKLARMTGVISAIVFMAAIFAIMPAAASAAEVDLTTGDAAIILSNHGAVQVLKDPAAGGGITASSGDGSRANPWLFNFTASSGGLNVGAFKVKAEYDAVELGNTDGGANFTLNMGGENVTGTSGNVSFSTAEDTTGWDGFGSGDIRIYNVNTVSIGAIDTHNAAHYEGPGSVYVGEPTGTGDGPAAGGIRIDWIDVHDTQAVGGMVKFYSAGDVLIQTNGGTAGNIDAFGPGARSGGEYFQVVANHQGDFTSGDILTYHARTNLSGNQFGNHYSLGGVQLDGGSAIGDAVIGNINTSLDLTNSSGLPEAGFKYWGSAGNIQITNYQNVMIASIDAHHVSGSSNTNADGGDVAITGITGNINILGAIDLSTSEFNSAQDSGSLQLVAGGQITLATLDMNKLLFAELQAVADSEITGSLLNFDTTAGSGSGSTFDPFVTSQTLLRTGIGKIIYYDAGNPDNAYLGGYTYQVADLLGNAGQGGWLTPGTSAVPEPATLALLSLGGLAMIGGAIRRRRGQDRN